MPDSGAGREPYPITAAHRERRQPVYAKRTQRHDHRLQARRPTVPVRFRSAASSASTFGKHILHNILYGFRLLAYYTHIYYIYNLIVFLLLKLYLLIVFAIDFGPLMTRYRRDFVILILTNTYVQ